MIHKKIEKTSATGAQATAGRTLVDTPNLLPPPDSNQRVERYRLLSEARRLLQIEGKKAGLSHPANFHQTAKCNYYRFGEFVKINKSVEHSKTFYSGVVQCGRVYTCPVCAAKVQERRRIEIAQAFDYAYNNDKKVIMVTFTFPHHNKQPLKDMLLKQSLAFKKFRQGNVWQKKKANVGFLGLIRSLEVTYGDLNGWHPHTHEAWIVDQKVNAEEFREWIARRWFNVCANSGLLPDGFHKFDKFLEHSVQITDWASNSDYLAKLDDSKHWGADRELAKGNVKQAKGKGSHPFDLLSKSIDGEKQSRVLFSEYADAMRGKAQIFWSRGLKSLVGVDELTDEQLATMEFDPAFPLGQLDKQDWSLIVKNQKQAFILDLAETSGFEGVRFYLDSLTKQTTDITAEIASEKRTLTNNIRTKAAAVAKEKKVTSTQTILSLPPLSLSNRTRTIAQQMVDEIRAKQDNLQETENKRAEQAALKKSEQVRQIKQRFQKQDEQNKKYFHPQRYG